MRRGPKAGVSFSNTPLTNVTVSVDSQIDGGTASTIDCDGATASTDPDGDGRATVSNLAADSTRHHSDLHDRDRPVTPGTTRRQHGGPRIRGPAPWIPARGHPSAEGLNPRTSTLGWGHPTVAPAPKTQGPAGGGGPGTPGGGPAGGASGGPGGSPGGGPPLATSGGGPPPLAASGGGPPPLAASGGGPPLATSGGGPPLPTPEGGPTGGSTPADHPARPPADHRSSRRRSHPPAGYPERPPADHRSHQLAGYPERRPADHRATTAARACDRPVATPTAADSTVVRSPAGTAGTPATPTCRVSWSRSAPGSPAPLEVGSPVPSSPADSVGDAIGRPGPRRRARRRGGWRGCWARRLRTGRTWIGRDVDIGRRVRNLDPDQLEQFGGEVLGRVGQLPGRGCRCRWRCSRRRRSRRGNPWLGATVLGSEAARVAAP